MSAPRRAPRLTVLGAGSWGTTFAGVLADGGADVTLWARREEVAREIREQHSNRGYLPDHRLPDAVHGTSHLEEALEGADGVVLAILFTALQAPDVALSEIAVGGAAVPLLFLVALMAVRAGKVEQASDEGRER